MTQRHLPSPLDQYDATWARALVDDLERYIAQRDSAISNGWEVSNHVENRSLDVSTATLGELRQVVGTFLTDMQTKGRLGT